MRYGLIYLLAVCYLVGLWLGGFGPLLVPFWVFVLIPILDRLLGLDVSDPDGYRPLYELFVRGWVPVQVALIGVSVVLVPSWEPLPAVLLALGLGIVTGAGGINLAHELVHRKSKLDRALGEVLMTSVSYPWWIVEHILGHHRWVATPRDPATARFGEPVYAFLPRSIGGSFTSFLHLERDYAGRRGIRWWSLRDRRTRYLVDLVVTYMVVAALGGVPGVLFFAGQSLFAVLLLEVINYVEHYGLVRAESKPGEYVRVAPEHSWNSNHWLTGAFLFNLPRHADHHAFASRPYYDLRPWPNAPELPLGYATMVLVALVPPLWFRVMNPRVETVRARLNESAA